MAGQNTLIIASDYNTIQSKIALIMGTGSGTLGYGQTLASSQVAQNSKISVSQWSNLRNDIARARQHQTGVALGTIAPGDAGYTAGVDLPIPTLATQVKESWRAAYLAMATLAETEALRAPPPVGQATPAQLVSQQIRTTQWNGTIRQTVIVTWPTANDARYFFNSGSQINFTSSRSGGTAGLKNVSWTTLLNGMGTISFNYTQTVTTGGGTGGNLGWYDLSTSDNLIFQRDTTTPTYSPNKYYIYARVNDTGADRRILYLTIHWEDSSAAPASFPDPGFGIDENVDGTLTSEVEVFRASGSNVSVPVPSANTTALA
jgi:hypothetical protein